MFLVEKLPRESAEVSDQPAGINSNSFLVQDVLQTGVTGVTGLRIMNKKNISEWYLKVAQYLHNTIFVQNTVVSWSGAILFYERGLLLKYFQTSIWNSFSERLKAGAWSDHWKTFCASYVCPKASVGIRAFGVVPNLLNQLYLIRMIFFFKLRTHCEILSLICQAG